MTLGQLPFSDALFIIVPGTLSWCVQTPLASHATCYSTVTIATARITRRETRGAWYHEIIASTAREGMIGEGPCMQGGSSACEGSRAADVALVRRPRRRGTRLVLDRDVAGASNHPLVRPSELEVHVGLSWKREVEGVQRVEVVG